MMKFTRALTLIALTFLMGACALQPTKTKDIVERKYDAADQLLEPIKLTEQTIVVDARAAFDYSVAHVPRSLNLQWTDFTQPDRDHRGLLQEDLGALTRRLARLGIGPSTPVVVVGKGLQGEGEEGRIAWTLAYLGVKNVQFAAMDSMRFRLTNSVEQNPPPNQPVWEPQPIASLNASREEIAAAINNNAVAKPFSYEGAQPTLYHIIDVRGEKNYLGSEGLGSRRNIPNMGAINIPWRQFFDENMRPRKEIAAKLKEVGIQPHNRVIVIDEDGVGSAGVTMVLRALGYSKAGNLAGGLVDLLASYPISK